MTTAKTAVGGSLLQFQVLANLAIELRTEPTEISS